MKLKVLYKEVGKKPEVKIIENELEDFQKLVDGLIELVYIDDGVCMFLNEEGKLIDLPHHIILEEIGDIVMGNVFIARENSEDGELIDLTDSDIEKYTKWLKDREVIING